MHAASFHAFAAVYDQWQFLCPVCPVSPAEPTDLLIIGAGIIGLACAKAALDRGLRVRLLEAQPAAVGASVRNFGFVTVTGQQRGAHYRRAQRSAEVWAEVAAQAGIHVCHRGLLLALQREEAEAVMEAFLATEMGQGLVRLSQAEAEQRVPGLQARAFIYSPHELRVESREALPLLADWLVARGLHYHPGTRVAHVECGRAETRTGAVFQADRIIVCPGVAVGELFPQLARERQLRTCTLQMLRVRSPSLQLGTALMSDLSLVRYEGYSALPEASALRARLEREQAAWLEAGIHLIAVGSRDGSIVLGDSHVYGEAEQPFASASIDELILTELTRLTGRRDVEVEERWIGTYPSADSPCFQADVMPGVRVVVVTGGTGASTGFALGEEAVEAICA